MDSFYPSIPGPPNDPADQRREREARASAATASWAATLLRPASPLFAQRNRLPNHMLHFDRGLKSRAELITVVTEGILNALIADLQRFKRSPIYGGLSP